MQVTNLNGAIKQITVGGVNYSFTGSSYMGTTAEWNNSNHKPAHGELIIYNDNGKIQFKIGDGTTLAKNLAFVELGGAVMPDYITTEEIDELFNITIADEVKY